MDATAYMNGTTKVVAIGDHRITVSRLKYGSRLERDALMRRFYDDNAGNTDPLNIARWNFFCVSTQTLDGAPCELAHSSDSDEEFAVKFGALLDLDADLVEAWVTGVNEMAMPLVDRAQLPAALLTDEEKRDPNSSSAGEKSSRKSGAR